MHGADSISASIATEDVGQAELGTDAVASSASRLPHSAPATELLAIAAKKKSPVLRSGCDVAVMGTACGVRGAW